MTYMKELIAKTREYLDYIEEHYDNVQKAWALINEKCKGKSFRFMSDDYVWHTIRAEVEAHDLSKLSFGEFTQYRQYFYPCKNEKMDKKQFNAAWAHHLEKNVHHWQYWVREEISNPYADAYLVMNVVDWVAMGLKFGDTAKEYYEKNKATIELPDWAETLMYQIFECIYEN